MSVVIDTSDVAVLEVSEFEPQGVETEANLEPEPQPELSDVDLPNDPPSDPPIATTMQADDGDDFKARIWNAEMRCRGKEAFVEDLKEQLKFAKADYEAAVAALRKLANECQQPSLPLWEKPNPNATNDLERLGHDGYVAAVNAELERQPPANDDSWRSHSLIDMLKSAKINGLGDKKLESLAEICQTFGDFEDLRTHASLEFVHLKDVLPDGFGEKITDQIEEAYFAAIKNISLSVIPEVIPEVVPDSESESVNLVDL